jgi:hypothetical protein
VASIWSNFQDILAWTTENGAVEQYNNIAGADSIKGTSVGQYSPPMVAEVGGEYVMLPGWCSNGETFPILTLRASMALMVVPSARMPAQDGTATPSKGEREGIVGTGVSRRPKADCWNASFLYYSYRRKRNNTPEPSTEQAGQFWSLFQAGKWANGTMAFSPPLIVEDSRYTAAKLKARRPSDLILPPTHKSVKRARNLIGIQGRVSL